MSEKMNKRRIIALAMLLSISSFAPAKNLGTFGQTYPIIEQDFLQWIKRRLHTLDENGTLETLKENWQQHIKTQSDRPVPVKGLTTTQQPRSWLFDPTITVKKDIIDTQGNTIAKAGQRFNPLTMVSLKTPLLFFNGDSPAQINWLKNTLREYHSRHLTLKAIAVQGSIKGLTDSLRQAIYFDQGGRLVAHFGIKQVPALIVQEGMALRIMEINLPRDVRSTN